MPNDRTPDPNPPSWAEYQQGDFDEASKLALHIIKGYFPTPPYGHIAPWLRQLDELVSLYGLRDCLDLVDFVRESPEAAWFRDNPLAHCLNPSTLLRCWLYIEWRLRKCWLSNAF